MSNAEIMQLSRRARQHEAATGELSEMLNNRIKSLRNKLRLPANNEVLALTSYIEHYIEHTPNMLNLLDNFPGESALTNLVSTIADCTRAFFPPAEDNNRENEGMFQLLCETYLAHRLLEELNDYVIGRAGTPLFPLDITLSNLLIHHLIGEPFSNQLDHSIEEISNIVFGPRRDLPLADSASTLARLTKQSSLKMETWPRTIEQLSLQNVLQRVMPPEENRAGVTPENEPVGFPPVSLRPSD